MTDGRKPHYDALLTSNIVPMYPAFKGILFVYAYFMCTAECKKDCWFFTCFETMQMIPDSPASVK